MSAWTSPKQLEARRENPRCQWPVDGGQPEAFFLLNPHVWREGARTRLFLPPDQLVCVGRHPLHGGKVQSLLKPGWVGLEI